MCPASGDVSGLHDQRHRTIVDKVHGHVSAKPSRFHGCSEPAQFIDELIDQRLGNVRSGRSEVRRPATLSGIGVERELTDHENLPGSL